EQADVRRKRVGRPGTPEQRCVWYLKGADPGKVQEPPQRGAAPGPPAVETGRAGGECPEPGRCGRPPRAKGGRPKGPIDPQVADRKKRMVAAWGGQELGENKAAYGRAYGFHRADATRYINQHEAARV